MVIHVNTNAAILLDLSEGPFRRTSLDSYPPTRSPGRALLICGHVEYPDCHPAGSWGVQGRFALDMCFGLCLLISGADCEPNPGECYNGSDPGARE